MAHSPMFKYLLWKQGLNALPPKAANKKYVDNLLEELRASQSVGQAVLLAMDGVYDPEGSPRSG